MYQVAKRISEVLVELGLGTKPEPATFTAKEIGKYYGGYAYMGTNARCKVNRGRVYPEGEGANWLSWFERLCGACCKLG